MINHCKCGRYESDEAPCARCHPIRRVVQAVRARRARRGMERRVRARVAELFMARGMQ